MYVCGSHGYSGLDGGRDGAGVGKHAGQSQEVSRMSINAGVHFECEVIN